MEINPLSVISFAIISSSYIASLFVLVMASFAVKKFSSLIGSYLGFFLISSLFIRLHGALAVAHRIFVAACRTCSCEMWDL